MCVCSHDADDHDERWACFLCDCFYFEEEDPDDVLYDANDDDPDWGDDFYAEVAA